MENQLQQNQQRLPIVELKRIESISAAHRLHSPHLSTEQNREIYGKCNSANGHGHNYKVEVIIKGPVDPKTGMVMNLAELKVVMQEVLGTLDHKNLDKDVPYFAQIPSTTENLTVYIWDQLRQAMRDPALLHKVRVHETDKNVFAYSGKMK